MKPTSCLVGLLVFLFSAVADAQPSKSFDGSLEKKKGIQPIHKVPSEAAKRAELTGQVFVVTNGRDNIKLALVEVNVIAEDIFMQYVKTRNEYRDEQMEVLSAHIEPAAVKAAQAAEMECLVATEAWRAMSREINKMRRDIGDVNKIQINDLLNKSNLLTQEICNIAESLDLKKKIY